MVGTIIGEIKKASQRKAKRQTTCMNQRKKKKKLVLLMVEGYFTHDPSNVTCMQVMRSNSNGKSRTCTTCQRNISFYSRC
jgi:hypothetical protein